MNEYLQILANILKYRQIKFILRIYQKSKNNRIKNIVILFGNSLYSIRFESDSEKIFSESNIECSACSSQYTRELTFVIYKNK
jgi:hypothetical protein